MTLELFLSLASIHLFALMSPGPDFALMLSKAYNARKAAVLTALGISVAIVVHTLLSLSGISLLIQSQPMLFTVVKIAGALYLGWMGLQLLQAGWQRPEIKISATEDTEHSLLKHFWQGFNTNMLNPKALVFFLTLFSTLVPAGTTLTDNAIILAIMFSLSFAWFGCLGVGLTHHRVRLALQNYAHWINGIAGLLFTLVSLSILGSVIYGFLAA